MKKLLLSAVACALTTSLLSSTPSLAQSSLDSAPQALGQGAVLSEIYGQGVHAYYAGKSTEAADLFSMAINNGSQDPRAYYFRGMVAFNGGNPFDAESDWQQGANLEVSGKGAGSIGRAISRFQGSGRLNLEEIRRKARLQYLTEAAARSRMRYGDSNATQNGTPQSASAVPRKAASAAPVAGINPPPAPPVADENPFAKDISEPKVETEDALSDAMTDPFADEPSAAADTSTEAPASDPFGSDAGGATADPFGGGTDAGSDPFGDDPFGN